jgi:AcrR family transcriptional regulator
MTDRTRTKRSDAALNRERILTAARSAFAATEAEVSMAEVARLSGVGSGTLYRNFATRRDLLEALYIDEVEVICAAASFTAADEAGPRFTAWMYRFFDFVVSKRHVAAELLAHTDRSDSVFEASRERVTAAGAPLLRAAQRVGEVRTDLTLDQILDMIVAIAKIPAEPGYVRPILDAALAGLREPVTDRRRTSPRQ